MSGGKLVVLDLRGRAVKQFPLETGLATVGRAQACDIRVMLPAVSPHHATVAVHANQTVVRNLSKEGATLVNGSAVSVAALRHNDVISICGRQLRWEYTRPELNRPLAPEPALSTGASRGRSARGVRHSTVGETERAAALRLALSHHRASMPGNVSGKQVAIVQPQRREPGALAGLHGPTQASLWIESRKQTPRNKSAAVRRSLSAKKSTPLRLTALRRAAHSATKHNDVKIQAPTRIDHTKQAAIMLMTGHTPKSKLPSPKSVNKTPSLVVKKKPSPVPKTPKTPRQGYSGRWSKDKSVTSPERVTPNARKSRSSPASDNSRRASRRNTAGNSVSMLDITDSDPRNSTKKYRQSRNSRLGSPLLPSPRKSALKDPKRARKNESIKFDLSNLENYQDDDVETNEDIHGRSSASESEDDITLHFSDASSVRSPHTPSPRKSIHSRSSRMLEKVGTTITESPVTNHSTLTPESPRARKSLRGSIILQKALGDSQNQKSRRTQSDATWDSAESTSKRTLTPRGSNIETYSVVDLVSVDSNESVYDSVGSTRSSSIMFGTPEGGRKTRSTIGSNLLGSSTPYVAPVKGRRSNSNSNVSTRNSRSPNKSTRSSLVPRRSKSLTTPENKTSPILNSTKVSRQSRSRSRINDSDLLYISSRIDASDNESPKSSRRSSKASQSQSPNASVKRQSSGGDATHVSEKSRRSNSRNNTLNDSQILDVVNASKASKRQSSLSNITSVSEKSQRLNRNSSLNDLTVSSLPSSRSSRSVISIANASQATNKRQSTGNVSASEKSRSRNGSLNDLTVSPVTSPRNSRSVISIANASKASKRQSSLSNVTALSEKSQRLSRNSSLNDLSVNSVHSSRSSRSIISIANVSQASNKRQSSLSNVSAVLEKSRTRLSRNGSLNDLTLSPVTSPKKSRSTVSNANASKASKRQSSLSNLSTASKKSQSEISRNGSLNDLTISPVTSPRNSRSVISIANSSKASKHNSSLSNVSTASKKSPSGISRNGSLNNLTVSPVTSPRNSRSIISFANVSKASKRQSSLNNLSTASKKSQSGISRNGSLNDLTVSPVTSPRSSRSIISIANTSKASKRQSSLSNVSTASKEPKGGNSRNGSLNVLSNTVRSPRISRSTVSLANVSNVSSKRRSGVTVNDKSRSRISIRSNNSSQSDLTMSPLTPKYTRSVTSSPRRSNSSRNNLTVNVTFTKTPQIEGTVTPDNQISPEEARTPVLNIRSLLDSSLVSVKSSKKKVSPNVKRKTIGVIRSTRKGRPSAKSKSLVFSNRKSSRHSKKSPVQINETYQSDVEEKVTPKSNIKLVPEAVKNKHSTAKKPLSKRSLIDNLNESDIVKQLFNSPVKRKLSQSMTEISRKRLFDDEDEIAMTRPKRNTIALTGRTPNNSLVELNQTNAFTPDKFVSPLSTPSNSPNLNGIKRLFGKNTPQNDLTDTRGLKNLMRTPRARRSIKNDLTNVSGVKEVFVEGPRNDLRRVTGVKALFRAQKEATVKNDLANVSGVGKLFKRKSVANDLRNVSGVKKTLQRSSPRNDLSDVRGVKKLFRQEKERDDLDVSGIEELFNISSSSLKDSNSIFDQLLDKQPARAVYSKSFANKRVNRGKKSRKATSFHVPANINTDNVREWLEHELKQRLHTASTSKANTSNLNKTRELQKLATDTVEGDDPIRTSRVRNSTLVKSQIDLSGRKKSASELYSAHTLPIKKRSFVEASLEKSKNESKHKLPIKKRVVVHSTPVKGRYNLTMNVSELSRVSPISLVDRTRAIDNDVTVRLIVPPAKAPKTTGRVSKISEKSSEEKAKSPRGKRAKLIANENQATSKKPESPKKGKLNKSQVTEVIVSPKPKGRRGAKAESIADNEAPKTRRTRNNTEKQESIKVSPKIRKTAAKVVKQTETKPSPRKTRGKVAQPAESSKATKASKNKKRASLVIAKKPPVLSPKPDTKRTTATNDTTPNQSPKKRVLTRKQKTEVSVNKTPKTTRAKTNKTTVVVTKPSPKLKPQTKKIAKDTSADETKPTRSTRGKATKEDVKTDKKSPQKSKGRKTRQIAETSQSKVVETVVSPKKGRKSAKKSESPVKAKQSKKSTIVDDVPTRRGRKTAVEEIKPEPVKRGRKTTGDLTSPVAKKTRNAKANPTTVQEAKKPQSRRKNVHFEEPKRKSDTVIDEPRGRKRKAEASPKKSEVVKSTRGRKTVTKLTEVATANGHEKKITVKDNKVEITRSRRRVCGALVEHTTRVTTVRTTRVGKATAAVEELPPVKENRKRKTAPASPATQSPPKRRRGAAASPADKRTRARPAATQETSRASRSRRR